MVGQTPPPIAGGNNGEHYLDRYGCAFGQVNRVRIQDTEQHIKQIQNKLSWLLYLLITELAATIVYMGTHWRQGP